MTRYLDGSLDAEIEAAIVETARQDAGRAMLEGATAPWGDGETLPDVRDLDRALAPENRIGDYSSTEPKLYAACYDKAFRAEIDRLGALVDEDLITRTEPHRDGDGKIVGLDCWTGSPGKELLLGIAYPGDDLGDGTVRLGGGIYRTPFGTMDQLRRIEDDRIAATERAYHLDSAERR